MKELFLLALLICMGFALCGDPYLEAQSTDSGDDVLWLARAMVAEAGLVAERDHAAIAHVLIRRWKAAARTNPGVSFSRIVRAYCAGLEHDDHRSVRLQWVYRLGYGSSPPPGWPARYPWAPTYRHWRKVTERAAAALYGALPDPCRGHAAFWGGPMDAPSSRLVRVDCGRTANTFYRVRIGR